MVKLFTPLLFGENPVSRPAVYPILNSENLIQGHFFNMSIDRCVMEQPFTFTHQANKCCMKFEVSIFDSNGFMTGGSNVASET